MRRDGCGAVSQLCRFLPVLMLMLIIGRPVIVSSAEEDGKADIEAWRRERQASLRAEEGWLSLVGLHWLSEGNTLVGSAEGSDVKLPEGAPANVGTYRVEGGRITFEPVDGVSVTRTGKPFGGGPVVSDVGGAPADVLGVGTLRLMVIRRGERHALRVKDTASHALRIFPGCVWYPVDLSWCIVGRWEPALVPEFLTMETIVGTRESYPSPGAVVFERGGQIYRIQATVEGKNLWLVFRDATSGKTTAANGRQLLAQPPDKDGKVVLDFNKAMSFPCAHTRYATCPRAPLINQLNLAIEAGEKVRNSAAASRQPR